MFSWKLLKYLQNLLNVPVQNTHIIVKLEENEVQIILGVFEAVIKHRFEEWAWWIHDVTLG